MTLPIIYLDAGLQVVVILFWQVPLVLEKLNLLEQSLKYSGQLKGDTIQISILLQLIGILKMSLEELFLKWREKM